MAIDTRLIYTDSDCQGNWLYEKYFYSGGNSRYYTFQLALNILNQRHDYPIIIETGCQRQEEDVGAGMSTSLFVEYISRYGGKVISVDNELMHLQRAKSYIQKWPGTNVQLVQSDSVAYLKNYKGKCDLLYLDSLDYPIAENEGNIRMQEDAQNHCLNELLAVESQLDDRSILLADDNQLSEGGKPRKLKEYLLGTGWTCLLDLQSTLWIRRV